MSDSREIFYLSFPFCLLFFFSGRFLPFPSQVQLFFSHNNPKMRFTAVFSIQTYYIKAYHAAIWLSRQLWQDNVGLREHACISCQPLSVISTPLKACSYKEAATKENPQDNTIYLRNHSMPQFPAGTKIFAVQCNPPAKQAEDAV